VTEISSGGVVIEDGDVVLCSRRTFGGPLRWGLPKGHVEDGETLEEAAAREATEETGLEVEVIKPLGEIDYWFVPPKGAGGERRRVHKFVHFFLMKAVGGDASNHDAETEEVRVFPGEEAVDVADYDSEKDMIRRAIEEVASWKT